MSACRVDAEALLTAVAGPSGFVSLIALEIVVQ